MLATLMRNVAVGSVGGGRLSALVTQPHFASSHMPATHCALEVPQSVSETHWTHCPSGAQTIGPPRWRNRWWSSTPPRADRDADPQVYVFSVPPSIVAQSAGASHCWRSAFKTRLQPPASTNTVDATRSGAGRSKLGPAPRYASHRTTASLALPDS